MIALLQNVYAELLYVEKEIRTLILKTNKEQEVHLYNQTGGSLILSKTTSL